MEVAPGLVRWTCFWDTVLFESRGAPTVDLGVPIPTLFSGFSVHPKYTRRVQTMVIGVPRETSQNVSANRLPVDRKGCP